MYKAMVYYSIFLCCDMYEEHSLTRHGFDGIVTMSIEVQRVLVEGENEQFLMYTLNATPPLILYPVTTIWCGSRYNSATDNF